MFRAYQRQTRTSERSIIGHLGYDENHWVAELTDGHIQLMPMTLVGRLPAVADYAAMYFWCRLANKKV